MCPISRYSRRRSVEIRHWPGGSRNRGMQIDRPGVGLRNSQKYLIPAKPTPDDRFALPRLRGTGRAMADFY